MDNKEEDKFQRKPNKNKIIWKNLHEKKADLKFNR